MLSTNRAGQVVYEPKQPFRDSTTPCCSHATLVAQILEHIAVCEAGAATARTRLWPTHFATEVPSATFPVADGDSARRHTAPLRLLPVPV